MPGDRPAAESARAGRIRSAAESAVAVGCLGSKGSAKCLPLGAGLNGRDCKVKRSQPTCRSGFPFKRDGPGRACAKSLRFCTLLARQVHDSNRLKNNDPSGCIPRPALTPAIPSPWPIPRAGDQVAGFWSFWSGDGFLGWSFIGCAKGYICVCSMRRAMGPTRTTPQLLRGRDRGGEPESRSFSSGFAAYACAAAPHGLVS
jgi:hypothetical protein